MRTGAQATKVLLNALPLSVHEARPEKLAFGVSAPAAAQRAAAEEYQRPTTASVVDGIGLDVEDQTFS